MIELYFLRHGETDWNKIGRIQGKTDNPLNKVGRLEAQMVGSCWDNIEFDRCYTSPLCRAKETAEIVLKNKKCEIIQEDLLKEISYGVDEGMALELIHENEELALHMFFSQPDKYIPSEEGETIENLLGRCEQFLCKMSEYTGAEDKKILVVCHGALIRGIITFVRGLLISDFWKGKELKNCSVTIVREEDGIWKIEKEAIDFLKEMHKAI